MSVNLLPAERSLGVGMASNPKNPFVCNICKKTYTRLDHLGRHYRTHTSEKPFTCDQCGKGFTRVDLLRRHRTNHLDRSHPAKQARARAQRATKACAACAASKLKCAETRPCHRCAAKNIPCLDEKNTQEPRGTVDSNGNDASRVGAGSVESQHVVEHDSSPILPSGAQSAAAQLLTPFTGSYGGSTDTAARYDLPDLPMDDTFGFDDTLMGDFLRDIVYPNPDFFDSGVRPSGPLPDVLDFGFSEFLDVPPSFYDRDPQPTAHFDITHTSVSRSRSGAVTPTVPRDIEIGQQAFKDSFWLWTPSSGDNRAAEQRFLTIAEDRVIREARNLQTPATLNVSLASRDRLLSLILGTCEPSIQRHVLSRFPSGELISSILTSFVALRFDAVGWWIHAPSLHINQEHESFLAGILAAAAVESHHPDIRRLGFAVQEAARIGVADRFEEDNTYTRDLRVLQAFALQLHAGFWSGGKRRMEIAESFTYPLITMLRRAGQFRKRSSTTVPEQGSGDDSSAEDLWREWIRMESLKRVAFHVLIQDSTISMSLLTNPLLFQAEFQLELPCSPALWTAASADEWKIAAATTLSAPLPTIRDALSNLYVTVENRNSIDIQLSLELIVSSLWSRVWQFHQMRAMVPLDGSGSNSLTANSLHQELVLGFKYIKMRSEEWGIELSPMVALKLEICLMHLHVSLEDIQVLGGKEGEIEARKTVPQLQTWSQSREARGALHHAGQALRAAAKFESGTLRGFAAVAVYHASLVLWAFGVLNDPGKTRSGLAGPAHALIQIDAEDSLDLQRFLMLGQGSPCIADYTALRHRGSSTSGGIAVSPATILVTNPLQIMNAIAALLTTGTNGSDDRGAALPIVANLSRLMRSLGKAAAIMKQTGIRSDS